MLGLLALSVGIAYRAAARGAGLATFLTQGRPPVTYLEYVQNRQQSEAVFDLVIKPAVDAKRRAQAEAGGADEAEQEIDVAVPVEPVVLGPMPSGPQESELPSPPFDAPDVMVPDVTAVAEDLTRMLQEERASAAAACEPAPAPVPAEPALPEPLQLHDVASEAAADANGQFTATQVVRAFNAWKWALGRTYNNADGEALELRAFAANVHLIQKYLDAPPAPVANQPVETKLSIPRSDGTQDWRTEYRLAAEARAEAEAAGRRAMAGRAAADDKLKLRQEEIGRQQQAAKRQARWRPRGGGVRGGAGRGR